jgi:hypothetical protein
VNGDVVGDCERERHRITFETTAKVAMNTKSIVPT